jgi:alpha-D-xyloside xylohydrolase
MKFRDGMWLVAEGVRPEYAEEVYSITQGEHGKALSLLCPTKKQPQRFDSLNMPTLTVVWDSSSFVLVTLTSPGHQSSI